MMLDFIFTHHIRRFSMKKLVCYKFFIVCTYVLLLTGCTACVQTESANVEIATRNKNNSRAVGNKMLRITNWNVETFFDCVSVGSEYSEFLKSNKWNKEAYIVRLERLCTAIKSIDADVFIMEEIENEGVIHDISNFMAGEWDTKKLYTYGCFAKDEGGSIGCGVISRYPLSDMHVHSLDVRTESESMPEVRPIIEVTVSNGESNLVLIINHWKSKSGGEEVSEKWRNRQEELLAKIIDRCVDDNKAVVACGDFNRDIDGFEKGATADVVLLRNSITNDTSSYNTQKGVEVITPWYDDAVIIQPGSYYFDNSWERIDNFFIAGNANCISFSPETKGPWCDSESFIPQKYELWNGNGYSDHLPISCTVQF